METLQLRGVSPWADADIVALTPFTGFTCLFQEYLPRSFMPRLRFFFNGFFSSIFILAVPVARRAQLGLYVARLSMDSTWQILAKKRKVRSSRYV